eukprot:TRINITY_DN9893_c0_g1_i1.p1 TRINITY_DN9893_c0_g1~~TRINITY_DN9893_c0_g1_i1.p1  ORF type:complete len:247 (-),score=32.27 TRINITY_DN9893_c0_g1_i1:124-864(-)
MNEERDSLNQLPEHLQRSWRELGGEGHLEVKNSFITVSSQHKQLPRSASWSGSSSRTSSQSESESSSFRRNRSGATAQPPEHFTFEVSDSGSASDGMTEQLDAHRSGKRKGPFKGQELHDMGQCTPCNSLFHGTNCVRGEDCEFCHLDHDDDIKRAHRRPCKATRNRCKKIIEKLQASYKDDPEELDKQLQSLICKHPYVAGLLRGYSELGARYCSEQSAVPDTEQDCATGQNPLASKNQRNLVSL